MNTSETASLQQLLRVLRRRKWAVLQAIVIVTAAAIGLSLRSATEYEATATLLLGSSKTAPIAGLPDTEQALSARTAAKLVRTRGVAERVRAALGSDAPASELLERVSTEADPATGFVEVTATAPEPNEAARLANLFVAEFVASREANVDTRIAAAIEVIQDELATLPAESPERQALASDLSRLRTLQALPAADSEVAERALAPTESSGPNPVRDGLVGAGFGLILGLALAFLLEAFDPRVKSTEELGRLISVPQLASVPASVFRKGLRPRTRKMPRVLVAAEHFEPFERLRTSLLFFNAERQLKTVLVTSPSQEREGKTTVASNLAVALAKTGLKVCVVDADLRRPRIARHFGLDGASAGLTDLIEGAAAKSVVQEFSIPDAPAIASGNGREPGRPPSVDVITSGHTTANPAELLASKRMHEVLDGLEREYDVVVLDCAPVLGAGDAMPLIARASGTLLVVRFFHTRREAAARAVRVLDQAHGGVLGVVGTGVPARELREEGYGPWPAAHPQRSHAS